MQERDLDEVSILNWKSMQYSEYMKTYNNYSFPLAHDIELIAQKINGYDNCFINKHYIESAISSIYTQHIYEATPDQLYTHAAKIYMLIANAHAAVDGNKRTACTAMFQFLYMNNAYAIQHLPCEFADMLFQLTGSTCSMNDAITSIAISLQLHYSTYKNSIE